MTAKAAGTAVTDRNAEAAGKILLVFPGQGSQRVGMGKEFLTAFPQSRRIFDQVNTALDRDLLKTIHEGSENELTRTENAQPAILTTSIIVLTYLQSLIGRPPAEIATAVAGHSLGEYTALVAAGAVELTTAVRLVAARGRAMQDAVPEGRGAMAALLGLPAATVEELCVDGCTIANDNAPGQIVISGYSEPVQKTMALARQNGCRRAILLPVSAPFHCRLMAPAQEIMRGHIESAEFTGSNRPVWQNVDAMPQQRTDIIKNNLIKQICARVRWTETIENAVKSGISLIVEVGHGSVLTSLCRRIAPTIPCLSLGSPADVTLMMRDNTFC